MTARHRRRKKSRPLRSFVTFVLIASLLAGGLYLAAVYFGNTDNPLTETLYPRKYERIVSRAAKEYTLDEALIYSVIRTESRFRERVVSSAGAVGLMQVMPESFEWLQGLRGASLNAESLYEPEINIDYGCYLLRYFYDYYGDKTLAIAAYNAGFAVSDWLDSDGNLSGEIPYGETASYVDKVLETEKKYNKLYYNNK